MVLSTQQNSQTAVIQLEVSPENVQQLDIADIDEVGRNIFAQLKNSGYTVTPTTTGRKGGGSAFDILISATQFLHDNKDWLLSSIPPVLESLLMFRDKLSKQEKEKRSPLKITLEINAKPLIIETTDIKDATKLVEQLIMDSEEAKKGISQSKVKIRVSVPRKSRRSSH